MTAMALRNIHTTGNSSRDKPLVKNETKTTSAFSPAYGALHIKENSMTSYQTDTF